MIDNLLVAHIKQVIFDSLDDPSGYKELECFGGKTGLSVIDGVYDLEKVAKAVIEAISSYKDSNA